jgi:hypothetical protein
MKTIKKPRKINRMSDEAVNAKTGKTWDQWFEILDKAGAKKLDHKSIVAIVHKHGAEPWWGQMVTVGYEQGRGLREKHQTPAGFHISSSKTLGIPLSRLYAAWHDPKTRRRWLKDPAIIIRKATPKKTMRITWIDGLTTLDVYFYDKGAGKSQIVVDHNKLPNAAAAKRMKEYWKKNLDRLQSILEA